jgi:two-component system, OmpR family, heavy metal sensor histidine kinase CusS
VFHESNREEALMLGAFLTGSSSEIDVARREPRTVEQYRQVLDTAADEANRLTGLADQLLFLSRQEAGTMPIDDEEVRLDALLKDVAEQFAGPADDAGVTIAIEPLEPWTVRGDDIRLSQVFYNVLDNAIIEPCLFKGDLKSKLCSAETRV